ncbi:MAG: hypothetical protein HZA53_16700 [Planctomycetes bacterium]|nr:hypothetical protein [Planctomycetota bacterium]
MRTSIHVLGFLGLFVGASCAGTRTLQDPTLALRTAGGRELGVSTDYGIVFLGRTAQSGRVEIESRFGDGPNLEPSVIEPIGAGLFTAETEIRLPVVPLAFEDPAPGTKLLVVGLGDAGPWEAWVSVMSDPRVFGIVTSNPSELEGKGNQIGAGVYLVPCDDRDQKRLIGLVAGEVELSTKDGDRRFLAITGPTDLWRLVAHRRDLLQRKRWVYRQDIL